MAPEESLQEILQVSIFLFLEYFLLLSEYAQCSRSFLLQMYYFSSALEGTIGLCYSIRTDQ